ncbi:MAG: TolC family protein [Elusimicrobiota bacterium]
MAGTSSGEDAGEPRENSSGRILSWEQAAALAKENNPALRAAREGLESARARRLARRERFLPAVAAEAGHSQSDASPGSPRKSYSAGLSARQNLFAGFQDKAALDRAQAELEEAEAALDGAAAAAAFDAKSAFAGLLFAQQQETVVQTIESRRRENVRLVELRFEAGREHRGAFLRSRAAHRQAQFEVSQARRARRVARRELAKALGLPPFDPLSVSGAFDVAEPAQEPDFPGLVPRTPAHRRARARLAAARAGEISARGAFAPDLSASGSLSRGGPDWPPDSESWSAGIALSIPLFSGGKNVYGLRDARAERRAAEAALRGAELQAALDLEEAFAAHQDAAERVDVQENFFEAARVRAEIARSQYSSGLLSFDDWDIIENELISREKEILAARRDAVRAEAAWESAQGAGLP